MALGLAPNLANAFLDAACRNTVANGTLGLPIAAVWVQLHIGDPGAAGTANTATETTRKQATFGTAAAGGAISNTAQLQWTSIAGSEDATHYSAWTASTAGTFLFSGTITANAYTAGDTYTVAVGDLDLTLAVAS
jgi:uncharacterized membrane protein YgdD (TMEM256/DUF423 family)